jgi:hypothetical protein
VFNIQSLALQRLLQPTPPLQRFTVPQSRIIIILMLFNFREEFITYIHILTNFFFREYPQSWALHARLQTADT